MAKTENYNSNASLKAVGVKVEFTEDNIKEYLKCKDDPTYFIDNYCMIVTLDHGIQPFKLYDCQKEKIDVIHNNRKVIIIEGRQQGKTTTAAAYILWYTVFQADKTVAILANKATTSREILSRYQSMYEALPLWMQQGIKVWNKGDVELENGSKVFTAATTASGIRGKSVNMLYIDEAAIIPNQVAEAFFTSIFPVISAGQTTKILIISAGQTTKILITSTPLGYNHFWTFWNDAEQKINDFVAHFIPYWKIPGRDAKWAEEQKRQLGELKYNQEVLCKFLGSSLTLISSDVIAQMSPVPPIYKKDGLDIFTKPLKNHTYVLVADTSQGLDGDFSAFTIVDITKTPYTISAKYRSNKISPLLYPNMIERVAKDFNSAYVLIEVNSDPQVADILYSELEYENILFVNRNAQGQTVSGGFGGGRTHYGVTTDKRVKRIGCSVFKSLVEEQKLIITDADIISEISTFIERRNSFAADEGYFDDCVMTLVLFSWLSTQSYFKDLNDVNLRKVMYENQMKAIEDELTPFGFYNDGSSEDEQPLLNF